MKRIFATVTLASFILFSSSVKNTASAQVGAGVSLSYQSFYDELSPHGRWIDYPEYGYVWAPNLGPGFQPYSTGGQWVWSDEYDWMWVSDYSWGWAPFHYGRWFHDAYYGWMWVPGYEWSPAWVSWRSGGDYYGWAPLRPGISISIGFGNYNPPYEYWNFAPRRYINHRNIGNYCVDRSRNVTIINHTTIINNYSNRHNVFVNGGPRRGDVERYTGRIRSVNFRETNRPGGREFRNNRVSVYRPQIQRGDDRRVAPRNFDRYNRDGQNNGNSIGRNGNSLPDRRDVSNNRTFGKRDNGSREAGNDEIANSRRNVFDRENSRVSGRESNQPNNQIPGPTERRNVFDRDGSNDRSNEQRQATTDRPIERRNVIDRNRRNDRIGDTNREIRGKENNSQQEQRTFERRNMDVIGKERGNERSNVFQRNNIPSQQPERRREIRNESLPQRQAQPQLERKPQREFRQFENRGNEQRSREQRGDNNGGGRGRNGKRDR